MSQRSSAAPPRILVVDDNPSIHEDFRKILGARPATQTHLESVEAALFGQNSGSDERPGFRIDSAFQGQDALMLVQKAIQENDPYVLAFVDVRMPPGWDGIETLEHIWDQAPDMQAVICTAYSDYSWDEMTLRLGETDSLLILKKPFETVEVLQVAHALAQKWALGRQAKLRMEDLDRMVQQRTAELQAEMEERTRVQEKLRASEERFSKAFQASPIPLALLCCADGRFLDVNRSFIELSGYPGDLLLQRGERDLQLWVKGGGPGGMVDPAALAANTRLRNQSRRLRRSDGSIRHTMLSTEPLSLGEKPCLLLIAEDVTEQLKLEAQLRQSQKMEVIGRMAAGIAHEFNNLLTVIQGDVGLLQTAPSNVDRRGLLDQIMQACQRAATFTRQLLAFSRKQVLQPRILNLGDVVQRMRKMLSRLIGERYEISLHVAPDLPSVLADEGGVEQILINLVLNSRDAMPDGGTIDIGTELETVDEVAASANPEARAGRFVCLKVCDRGCGMTAQVLSHIFDPFFTTKDVGKGTGLGLSTIHGIVKQHEGWIEVASEVNRGSLFKIYLPACTGAPLPVRAVEAPPLPEPGKGETVLVVEDEAAVRELACAALEKRGYQVLKAASGPQAIEVWDRCPTPVSLLLTDMVMPSGMSGADLARILQARNANLKVIYTSGYSPEIWRKDSLLTQGINFLPKPYNLQSLLNAVRLCLDGGKLPFYETRPGKTHTATTS